MADVVGEREYERPKNYTGTTSPSALARAVTSSPNPSTYDPTPAGHLTRIPARGES